MVKVLFVDDKRYATCVRNPLEIQQLQGSRLVRTGLRLNPKKDPVHASQDVRRSVVGVVAANVVDRIRSRLLERFVYLVFDFRLGGLCHDLLLNEHAIGVERTFAVFNLLVGVREAVHKVKPGDV